MPDTAGVPEPAEGEVPVLHRSIDTQAYERDGHYLVTGTLHDERPWAGDGPGPQHVHHMELRIMVRRSDLVITAAEATMGAYPHAECPEIAPSFSDLVGLSVSRGYTRAVLERFGRTRGCSHLEFLARVMGPTVLQAVAASSAKHSVDPSARPVLTSGARRWLTDTCHIWEQGGVVEQKIEAGWMPLRDVYPAPRLVEIRRRAQGEPDEA